MSKHSGAKGKNLTAKPRKRITEGERSRRIANLQKRAAQFRPKEEGA